MIKIGYMEYKFTIPGRPITKKNSQQIWKNRRTGKPFIVQKKKYKEFEQSAMFHLLSQKPKRTITSIIDICVKYYMPNRQSKPDLSNLLQATCDVLQKSMIISNDKNIRRFGIGNEHSEIVGLDKQNPRTEIILKEVENDKTKRTEI